MENETLTPQELEPDTQETVDSEVVEKAEPAAEETAEAAAAAAV